MNEFTDMIGIFVAVKIFNVAEKRRQIDFFVIVFRQMLMANAFNATRHTCNERNVV